MSTKLLATAVFAFGVVLSLGASGEIVLALNPGLLPPEATAIPFMAAHRTSWALRGWMLVSNAANLGCAAAIATAALMIRRGEAQGWRRLRLATAGLAVIALLGVPVCLGYLLPIPAGPAGPSSRFFLVSVVGASMGLATTCAFLFRRATRALAQLPG